MRLNLTAICVSALILGACFWAWQKEWLILRGPVKSFSYSNIMAAPTKPVTIYFWKNQRWHQEQDSMLWDQGRCLNLQRLVQSWVAINAAEGLISHHLTLQACIIHQQTGYLSFEQPLFEKHFSTYQKVMLIESLLKSIRENHIQITQIQFLCQNHPMSDSHLDFSRPWPTQGFVAN